MVRSEKYLVDEFARAEKGIKEEVAKMVAEKDPIRKMYSKTNVLRWVRSTR